MKSWAQSWLDLQCRMISDVHRGIVVLGKPDEGPYLPSAVWPADANDLSDICKSAESALASRRTVVDGPEDVGESLTGQRAKIAHPILLGNQLLGVVAIEIKRRSAAEQQTIVELLAWGANWLKWFLTEHEQFSKDKLTAVLGLVATCLEQERFQAAAMATVTDLAARLECERVSIGFRQHGRTSVHALSNSARFGERSNLIRDIEGAMDEVMDQGKTITFPSDKDTKGLVTRANAELARRHESGGICATPFAIGGRVLGALVFESSRPMPRATVELCEHAASVIGPVLDTKRRADRWLPLQALDSVRSGLSRLFGKRNYAVKAVVASVLGVACFFAFANGDYRIKAPASLEGTVQRAVVAPMDGFITDATVRPGDRVAAGELVAKLDDRDLSLERLKWVSRLDQLQKEYRNALAAHERAEVRILGAKIAQADAELELLQEQLSRVRLAAPFDGIVVSGDLSQSLGSPVERGQILFEVAPLDSYRIVLKVDERDYAGTEVGQSGELVLSGLPGERLRFSVNKITPVSLAKEGQNYFRVEAQLAEPSNLLQPGMEGIGKIHVGRRNLFWIWTHRMVEWMQLAAWSWWP